MKKFVSEFFLRGFIAAVWGPVVLAIIYGVLGAKDVVTTFTVNEVVLGIISSAVLAFMVSGITAIYQVERLALAHAILIHAIVLYAIYISIYLVNGWLKSQIVPVIIFTVAFVVGYAVIWACIYLITKGKTNDINRKLNAQA